MSDSASALPPRLSLEQLCNKNVGLRDALTLGTLLLLLTLSAYGCAAQASVSEVVILDPSDGPLWLESSDIARFRCSVAVFVCTDEVGRLSTRRCQCVEQAPFPR